MIAVEKSLKEDFEFLIDGDCDIEVAKMENLTLAEEWLTPADTSSPASIIIFLDGESGPR